MESGFQKVLFSSFESLQKFYSHFNGQVQESGNLLARNMKYFAKLNENLSIFSSMRSLRSFAAIIKKCFKQIIRLKYQFSLYC